MDFRSTRIINLAKIAIILIILALFIILIRKIPRNSLMEQDYLQKEDIGDNMEMIFLNLGKADSIIIRYEDKVLLIDTGEVEHGSHIVKNLENMGVDKIDYMILTHPDKDHIGGAVDIINSIKVDTIIQSPLNNGKKLQVLLDATIKEKAIKNIIPHENFEISLGLVNIEVFSPEKTSYKKDNDYSLLTLISHEKLKFFFGGDAEKKRLKEALKYDLPKIDLYKVPHHGRFNSLSEEMIKLISPEISIITNISADPQLIQALEDEGSEILYTGEKNIRILSNGERLIIK